MIGDGMRPGSILVEQSTFLPESIRLESASNGTGWASVVNNRDKHELAKTLTATGWEFFFMAGGITVTSFGLDGAMKHLIAAVKLQNCNSLEIDCVTSHSFLGMPYVSVTGHARHIQKPGIFSGGS